MWRSRNEKKKTRMKKTMRKMRKKSIRIRGLPVAVKAEEGPEAKIIKTLRRSRLSRKKKSLLAHPPPPELKRKSRSHRKARPRLSARSLRPTR